LFLRVWFELAPPRAFGDAPTIGGHDPAGCSEKIFFTDKRGPDGDDSRHDRLCRFLDYRDHSQRHGQGVPSDSDIAGLGPSLDSIDYSIPRNPTGGARISAQTTAFLNASCDNFGGIFLSMAAA